MEYLTAVPAKYCANFHELNAHWQNNGLFNVMKDTETGREKVGEMSKNTFPTAQIDFKYGPRHKLKGAHIHWADSPEPLKR